MGFCSSQSKVSGPWIISPPLVDWAGLGIASWKPSTSFPGQNKKGSVLHHLPWASAHLAWGQLIKSILRAFQQSSHHSFTIPDGERLVWWILFRVASLWPSRWTDWLPVIRSGSLWTRFTVRSEVISSERTRAEKLQKPGVQDWMCNPSSSTAHTCSYTSAQALQHLVAVFIYLATPDLSCGSLDLWSSLLHAGSLLEVCKLLVVVQWDLVPQPGIKLVPRALEAWSFRHYTIREVPWGQFLSQF